MLKHPTEERLSALGLTGMAKALEEQRGLCNMAMPSVPRMLAPKVLSY